MKECDSRSYLVDEISSEKLRKDLHSRIVARTSMRCFCDRLRDHRVAEISDDTIKFVYRKHRFPMMSLFQKTNWARRQAFETGYLRKKEELRTQMLTMKTR